MYRLIKGMFRSLKKSKPSKNGDIRILCWLGHGKNGMQITSRRYYQWILHRGIDQLKDCPNRSGKTVYLYNR